MMLGGWCSSSSIRQIGIGVANQQRPFRLVREVGHHEATRWGKSHPTTLAHCLAMISFSPIAT